MLTLNPKVQPYQFEMKTPINCLKMPKPLNEDSLMSLLDGNPVPRTLKWKLKGYKTLRNEQAGDFAFVPGGKSHEFDLLSRKHCGEALNGNRVPKSPPDAKSVSKTENAGSVEKKCTLSLTAKAIENKSHVEAAVKRESLQANSAKATKVEKAAAEKMKAPKSPKDESVLKDGAAVQKISPVNKVLATAAKKEEPKFLPISKSDFSAGQMKYQTQQAAQYSSRPPKRISKPMPPVLHQQAKRVADTKKLSAIEVLRHKKLPPWMPKTRKERDPAEAAAETTKEWSAMEQRIEAKEAAMREEAAERDATQNEYSARAEERPEEQRQYMQEEQARDVETEGENPRSYSRKPDSYQEETLVSHSSGTGQAEPKGEPSYFAPKAWNHSESGVPRSPARFVQSTSETLHSTYESIGVPSRPTPLKIASPQDKQQKSSPCAASQARLQEAGRAAERQQPGSFGGDGSSMSNSGGGGSRKPPSFSPFTRRASTDSSSLTRKFQLKATQNPRRSINSRTSKSNISTSSIQQAPKKCKDSDDQKSEGKTICTKPRNRRKSCDRQNTCQERSKCQERERPKCQERREPKKKKKCKRYCCPLLQTPTDCDYDKFQCPKKKSKCGGRSSRSEKPKKKAVDPTCMSNEEQSCGGRQACTETSRRADSSKRTRSCDR